MNVANGALAERPEHAHAFQFERGQIENGVARTAAALGRCAMFHNYDELPFQGQAKQGEPAPDH